MRRRHACLSSLVVFAAALAASAAAAAPPQVAFDGGTAPQRNEVRKALQASAFDWSLVPGAVTVHIRRGITSEAAPRHVWLDAGLLDSGEFAWGVILHEFAHQIDYLVLSDADRAALAALLGGRAWCSLPEGFAHDERACERFATSVSWAYWPSAANVFDPAKNGDEVWLQAAAFRSALTGLLGVEDPPALRRILFSG